MQFLLTDNTVYRKDLPTQSFKQCRHLPSPKFNISPEDKLMKTKVFITIDTEFSICGAFHDPSKCSPVGEQAVFCNVDGKSHGLGFLLDTFKENAVTATFFIEVFNSYFFGDAPMRDIALQIQSSDHDIQMHVHPCWTYFKNPDWMSSLKDNPPTDHMDNRSFEQISEWIKDGLAIFERWGLSKPTAMRTGSLITDRTVYTAMEALGITVASNVGVGIYPPKEAELHLYSGMHKVGEVLEVPVLTYIDRQIGNHAHHRLLTITGASASETRSLLLQAHAANIEAVVILTHPFEYVKYDPLDYDKMHPNRINQQRLRKLCAFLAENGDQFEIATFNQLNAKSVSADPQSNVLLKAPSLPVVGRMIENILNDHIKYL